MKKDKNFWDKILNTGETALRQSRQGATFGFGDELTDALAAVIAGANKNITINEAWKEARKLSREKQVADWQDAPVTSFAANVAGSMPFGLSAAGKGLANWAATGGRLARAGKGAATGAALGGVSGFGSQFGGLADRGTAAGIGAVIGGAAGGAAGAVTRGKPTVVKTAKEASKDISSNRAQEKFLTELLQRPDLSDMQKRMIANQAISQRTGVELTLPEMLAQTDVDPLLSQQSVLAKSPETTGYVQSLLQRRMGDPLAGQRGQIEQALQTTSGKLAEGSYDDLAQGLIKSGKEGAQKITAQLSKQAEPLYAEAMTKSVPPNNFTKLIRENPILENALKAAYKDERFSAQLKDVPVNSIKAIDAAKRIIDEKIRSGANPAQPFDTRAYVAAKDAMLGLADQYAPSYAQARNIYSSQAETLANRSLMGELAGIDQLSPEKVVTQLYSGTVGTAKKTAEALGEKSKMAAAAKIQDIIGGLKAGNMPPKLDADTIEMMRAYAGQDADLVSDLLRVVDKARTGERFLRGSQTATNQATQQGMRDAAEKAAVDVVTGNKIGLLQRGYGAIKDAVRGGSQEQYNRDLWELFSQPHGADLVNQAVAKQADLMSKTPSQAALLASQTSVNPVMQSATGLTAKLPQQEYFSPMSAPYSTIPALTASTSAQLPQGFRLLEDDKKQLPKGFRLMEGQ